MNLRDQINEIADTVVNPDWRKSCGLVRVIQELIVMAWIERWPESADTRALRKGWECLNSEPYYLGPNIDGVE